MYTRHPCGSEPPNIRRDKDSIKSISLASRPIRAGSPLSNGTPYTDRKLVSASMTLISYGNSFFSSISQGKSLIRLHGNVATYSIPEKNCCAGPLPTQKETRKTFLRFAPQGDCRYSLVIAPVIIFGKPIAQEISTKAEPKQTDLTISNANDQLPLHFIRFRDTL